MSGVALRLPARIFLFLVGAVLLSHAGLGQSPERELTLPEALEMFGQNNHELRLARLRNAEFSALARKAAAYPNPTISVTHEPLRDDGTSFSESYAYISQQIEWPGLRRARFEAANQLAVSSRAGFETDSLRLVFDVRSTFLESIAARERISVLLSVTDLFRQAELSTEAMVREGEASGFDLRRVRIERARYENMFAETELGAMETSRKLRYLIAPEDSGAPFYPTGEAVEHQILVSLESAVESALSNRSELQGARANVASARSHVRFSQLENKPEPAIEAGYKRKSDGFQGAFLGLSTSLPLFDRNRGAIAADQSRLHAAETRLLVTERLIENDVRRTHEVYSSLADRYERVNATLAEEADALFQSARSGYAEDEIPLVALLDAAEAYRDAHFAKIDLFRDFQLAYFDLLRAIGAGDPPLEP